MLELMPAYALLLVMALDLARELWKRYLRFDRFLRMQKEGSEKEP